MSQISQFVDTGGLSTLATLTGDVGGAVGPDGAGNIDIVGGVGVTVTGTPASNQLEIAAAGIDQDNVLYVGKHGNDANDGLTIDKAFLTFGAALTAASSGDVIRCFDAGTYTENLTGVSGVDIYAPNATISGVHTVNALNTWYFSRALVAAGTTGFTFNQAGSAAYLRVARITVSGNGIGAVALAGRYFIDIERILVEDGFFIGTTTTDIVESKFLEIIFSGAGTAYGVSDGSMLHIRGNNVENDGIAGDGQLFFSTGAGAPTIDAVISHVDLENFSDITATTEARLLVTNLEGTLAEIGGSTVIVSGATRIDDVPIGSVTPNSGDFTTVTATTPIAVSSGGTGAATLTDHGILLGSGTGAITPLGVATDGQIPIGLTGADPILGNITSTGATVTITNGPGSINLETSEAVEAFSGFDEWDGGSPYFDDSTLGSFTVSQSGTGYIQGTAVSWTAPQTVTGITAGNTYYIYIDNTGTIGKTTTYSESLFRNNIVLFEILRDSTAPTNTQFTVKENHPYEVPFLTSLYLHDVIGVVIANNQGGANIVLNGTQKIEISGADELEDHGLKTDIPDSAGVGVTWNNVYTNGSGKWALYATTDTFDGTYNNAGTPTALGANKYGICSLYVSKDNLNTTTPTYFALLNNAQYNNLASAQTAVANGTVVTVTAELAALELARLGYIIFEESSTSIVDVVIDKETLRSTSSTSGTNSASLILTDTVDFDGILSASDTTVQTALNTIDEWGKTTTDHALLLGNGTGSPIGSLAVGATGEMLIGNTGADPTWSTTGTLTTMNATTFDTNVAAAGLTLSGTTLSADGTDADIDINITAKGTGQVIIDDLQLTTELAVEDGGTGAGTFTDHGILLGSGTGAITATAAPTDGQLLIGSTGNDPSIATLTEGTNIDITNAAGSITVESTKSEINAQTGTTYTLVIGDRGKVITCSNASAITLTVPPNSSVAFATGTMIGLIMEGAGQLSVAAGSGVTIDSEGSKLKLDGQYSSAVLIKKGTDLWNLSGQIKS